jgi:hypothetical protein
LPSGSEVFSPNDFYDLVRSVGGDTVEQVTHFFFKFYFYVSELGEVPVTYNTGGNFFYPDLFFINKKKYRQILLTVEQRKIIYANCKARLG